MEVVLALYLNGAVLFKSTPMTPSQCQQAISMIESITAWKKPGVVYRCEQNQ